MKVSYYRTIWPVNAILFGFLTVITGVALYAYRSETPAVLFSTSTKVQFGPLTLTDVEVGL